MTRQLAGMTPLLDKEGKVLLYNTIFSPPFYGGVLPDGTVREGGVWFWIANRLLWIGALAREFFLILASGDIKLNDL